MEIKKLNFKKQEVEINETYLDEDGKIKERKKKVLVSTGELEETDREGQENPDGNVKDIL